MPTYELTDDTTGMTIEVYGAEQLTEESVRQYIAQARQQAAKAIEDNSYTRDDETQLPLNKEQSRQRLRKFSAYALGVKPDEVDINTGMGLWERTKLDLLPDEPSRMEYLEKKYGPENVSMLNVGGKPKMFYRDPKSKKMTMVDEMGASLADFTADIAGEAVTTTGAVGGAIVGSTLGPGGTIAGATTGAALGGFLTGVTQDVVAEAATGQDIELEKKLKRRGFESFVVGVPIDLATLGVGRVFARGIAGKGAASLVKEFDTAASRVDQLLAKERARLPNVQALRTGRGSVQASQIAAARPTSKLAKELQSVRDRVGTLRESLEGRGRAGVSADEFNRIADDIAQNYRRITEEVELVDKGLAKELREQASRKMQTLAAPKVSEMEVGGRLQNILTRAEGQAGQTNSANWAMLDQMARDSGVVIPGKRVANTIRQAAKQMEPFENDALMKLAKDIEGVDNLSFTDLRRRLAQIEDAVPDKEAGFKTAQQVSIAAGKAVRDLRDKIAKESGQALEDQYNRTTSYYLNDYLNFKRQAVGGALKDTQGAMVQPEVAVRSLLSNGSSVRAALRAARQGGAAEESALRNELRDLYLNRIGVMEGADLKSGFTFNEDIVRELWGSRQLRELKNLQNRLAQMKDVDIVNLEPREVNQYLSALSNNERSEIFRQIRSRNKNAATLDRLEISALNRMLKPVRGKRTGKWGESEMSGIGLAQFAEKFVKAKPNEVKRTMKLLRDQNDPIGLQAFRQSYIGKLFDNFASGAQVDRYGNPLWNPERFARAMKEGKKEYINAVEILGKEGVDDLLAANRVLLEAAETTGKDIQDIFQPRYSLTSGGLQLYGVGNLIGGLRGRLMAWAYGTRMGSKIMRFLTNPGDDAATEEALRKILPALMTSSAGIKAAAIQGEFDPEFTEQIAPLYGAQGDDTDSTTP